MQTKQCSKCGEVKAVSEFNKSKRAKDGLYCYCKKCQRQYRVDNRDKMLKQQKEWYIKNKPKLKEVRRQYRLDNKIAENERCKKWRRLNTEKASFLNKKYKNKAKRLLLDSYIKSLIGVQTNGMLKAGDIPQELIELKRNNLILKRKIKDNGKEATNL